MIISTTLCEPWARVDTARAYLAVGVLVLQAVALNLRATPAVPVLTLRRGAASPR
jgi:hypothetical protein